MFLQATEAFHRAGRAVRRTAANFAMGMILYLLAAAFVFAAALVLAAALYCGLVLVMLKGAALTIIGLLLLAAALVAWLVGRNKLHGPH